MHTISVDSVVLCMGRILDARAPSPPSPQGSLSISSRTRWSLQGPHAASLSPSSPRSIDTFLVFGKPPEAKLLHLLFLVFTSAGILCLYPLLKSAANAVLKLMFAVIATAHVLFVSLKSVISMLLEYSLGKLKYDSTTFGTVFEIFLLHAQLTTPDSKNCQINTINPPKPPIFPAHGHF